MGRRHAEHKSALYVNAGKYQQGEPSVKYRGIFFNDEKPDLDHWVRAKFGERTVPGGTAANFNSAFYSKVFEVILRMKGNYLWPAMWNNAFDEDDPANPRLADEYGIVMGTSHQEPMLRAQKEWDWHLRAANGNWNYATQPAILDDFWRQGIRQHKDFESIYTMGLRGENDSAMVRTAAEGVALTEKIVAAQRKMLAEEVNPDVTKVPQLWALYKEVQQYYEGGLRVPDDITLLWAEDNWGNVRRLPTPEERKRSGGAGIYYHFDYHGGPRSYQWVNTSPVNKIWEQMSLAKQYGADRIWIVNVGHFKGYELPTEFFLNLGWNTAQWHGDTVNEFTRQWAEREFGAAYASEVCGDCRRLHRLQCPPQTRIARARHLQPGQLSRSRARRGRLQRPCRPRGSSLREDSRSQAGRLFPTGPVPHQGIRESERDVCRRGQERSLRFAKPGQRQCLGRQGEDPV